MEGRGAEELEEQHGDSSISRLGRGGPTCPQEDGCAFCCYCFSKVKLIAILTLRQLKSALFCLENGADPAPT